MAVTVNQLAVALRITADADVTPDAAIVLNLTRLLGVADSFVAIHAPTAPTAVKDEAVVRFCGYMYDAPTAGRGQSYASMWSNSGAASVLAPWIDIRAAAAASDAPSNVPAGLSQQQVISLIQSQVADFALTTSDVQLPNSKIKSLAITFARLAATVALRLLPDNAANGQIAQWDGSKWAAVALPSTTPADGSITIAKLASALARRVLPATATTGQIVKWNGTNWVASDESGGEVLPEDVVPLGALFTDEYTRTWSSGVSNANGEAVISIDNGISQGAPDSTHGDAVIMDYHDADGNDQSAVIKSYGAGDWLWAESGTGSNKTYIVYEIFSRSDDSTNNVANFWFNKDDAKSHVHAYEQMTNGTGTIRFLRKQTIARLRDELPGADVTSGANVNGLLTTDFNKWAVADARAHILGPETMALTIGNYTRKGNGVTVTSGQWCYFNPSINQIAFSPADTQDSAHFALFWKKGLRLMIGTRIFQLTGENISHYNGVYYGNATLVGGTDPAIDASASLKFLGDVVHWGSVGEGGLALLTFGTAPPTGTKIIQSASGTLSWVDKPAGGSGTLSDDTPLKPGTGAAGTADAASRKDHVHPMPDTELGIEVSSNKLRVKLDGSSLTRGANGLKVTNEAPDGLPDAPANQSAVKKYNLNVPASSGDATWVEDAGGGGATGIPNAPANQSAVKKYVLNVPASSGDATWVEPAATGKVSLGTWSDSSIPSGHRTKLNPNSPALNVPSGTQFLHFGLDPSSVDPGSPYGNLVTVPIAVWNKIAAAGVSSNFAFNTVWSNTNSFDISEILGRGINQTGTGGSGRYVRVGKSGTQILIATDETKLAVSIWTEA